MKRKLEWIIQRNSRLACTIFEHHTNVWSIEMASSLSERKNAYKLFTRSVFPLYSFYQNESKNQSVGELVFVVFNFGA